MKIKVKHYGKCDVCNKKFTEIYHYNYGDKNDFRVCESCLTEALIFMRNNENN